MIRGWFYRLIMKIAHRYHWHYAPPLVEIGGDIQLWCKWCDFRQTQRNSKGSGKRPKSIEETKQLSLSVPVDMSSFNEATHEN